MNYSEQIFKMLGIKPMEEFELKHTPSGEKLSGIYKLDENLNMPCLTLADGWKIFTDNTLKLILNSVLKIVKIQKPTPKLTPEEKIAIEYAKMCKFKWLAKDKNGMTFAYLNKPFKSFVYSPDSWLAGSNKNINYLRLGYDISFLSWEDEEPFYIGD